METSLRTVQALLASALLTTGVSIAQNQNSYAQTFAVATYPAKDPLKLWMHVEKKSPETRLKVILTDKKNRVLFSEVLPKKDRTYRQQVDLSQVADGLYTLQITDGSAVVENAFQVKPPLIQAQLPNRLLTVVNKPPTAITNSSY